MFEVIVVDDGTPDYSMKVVEAITHQHSNLHVIHQENGGLSRARNAGLLKAVGDYVWFIDADDWVTFDAIGQVLSIINDQEGIDVIATGLMWTWGSDDIRKVDIKVTNNVILNNNEYIDKGFPKGAIQRFIMKRELVIKHNLMFYPGIFHEDGLFGNQLLFFARKIYVVSKPFYYYRQREDGSIMHNIGIKSAYDLMIVHNELMKFADLYCERKHRKWFNYTVLNCAISSITFTWHLRQTDDFKKFCSKYLSYIRKQAYNALWQPNIKRNIKLLIIIISPILYARIIKRQN